MSAPVRIIPFKVSWHGKNFSDTRLTFRIGTTVKNVQEYEQAIELYGDHDVLKIVATAHGKKGKAWIPLDDINVSDIRPVYDMEYVPLVDKFGSPVADLQVIIIAPASFLKGWPWGDVPADCIEGGIGIPPKTSAPKTSGPAPSFWERGESVLQRRQKEVKEKEAQPHAGVALMVLEARGLPNVEPVCVELSVGPHYARTGLGRTTGEPGFAYWGEVYLVGIWPQDDLVVCIVGPDGVVGSGFVKGHRLLGRRGRDFHVDLADNSGVPCGQVLLSVGGGSVGAVVDWGVTEIRDTELDTQSWLATLSSRSQALEARGARQHVSVTAERLRELLPPPPPQTVAVEPKDYYITAPKVVSEEVGTGRGLCLRVEGVEGRQPAGLHVQIGAAGVMQQATLLDALDAFFSLTLGADEAVAVRLLRGGAVVAHGRVAAAQLLTGAPVALQMYDDSGARDCVLTLRHLPDGPMGYVFGSGAHPASPVTVL